MRSNTPDDLFFDPVIYESQFAHIVQFADIRFWIQLAKHFGPRVLELACGNGRVTIPVFQSGVTIDGVDFSEPMLDVARSRAEAHSLLINFFPGDLRSLTLKDQYDFMFLPSATISHLIHRSEVEAFLAGARKGLRSNGVLALDFHNPLTTWLKPWPLDLSPKQSTFELLTTNETVHLTTTPSFRAETRIFALNFVYAFANGSRKEATLVFRLYFPADVETLLSSNGFDVVRTYGDYTESDFTADHSKCVIVARKRS